jgi:glutaminyl-peptide cyclotransferase
VSPRPSSGPSRRILALVVGVQLAVVIAAVTAVILLLDGGGGDAGSAAAPRPATTAPATGTAAAAGPRVDRFDAARAFALLRRQVEVYGPRPAGSRALRRLAVDLRARLPEGRLEAVPGHPGLRNVVGRLAGRRPAILVAAHYDVEARPRGFVGANDGAAGTAAVVEIARALRRLPAPAGAREVRFALFDGEEEPPGSTDFLADALRGSKAYARAHGDRVGSMVLLDYVANKGLRLPREGTSDPALWQRLRAAARRVGVQSVFPDADGPSLLDDHTPFQALGIPTIDLIDFSYRHRDTLADTVDKVSAGSLDAVGETVVELVRELRAR